MSQHSRSPPDSMPRQMCLCCSPSCMTQASPGLLQEQYRGPKAPAFEPENLPGPPGIPPSAAPMLYTGDDPEAARQLMAAMWARSSSITDAVRPGSCRQYSLQAWAQNGAAKPSQKHLVHTTHTSLCCFSRSLKQHFRRQTPCRSRPSPQPTCSLLMCSPSHVGQVMAAYLAAGPGAPTSTENATIASEAQFVEATGALARGLVQFDLSMGAWVGCAVFFQLLVKLSFS